MRNNIKKYIALKVVGIYSSVTHHLSRPKKYMINKIIKKIPDDMIYKNIKKKTHLRKKITIIDARSLKTGRCIKNKLKLYLYANWEDQCCDMNGGACLDNFSKIIKDDVIFIKYIITCDIKNFEKEKKLVKLRSFLKKRRSFLKKRRSFLKKNSESREGSYSSKYRTYKKYRLNLKNSIFKNISKDTRKEKKQERLLFPKNDDRRNKIKIKQRVKNYITNRKIKKTMTRFIKSTPKYSYRNENNTYMYMTMKIDLKNKILFRNGDPQPESILFGEILFDTVDDE